MSRLRFKNEAADPAAPPSGYMEFYGVANVLYWIDSAGVVRSIADGTGDLKADGTIPLAANWDIGAFEITGLRFHSDEVTLSPFTVASAVVVSNLNADKVDGADLIDEDNMASDSAVHVPTQQSVKAYVDATVAGGVQYIGAYDASTNTPDLDTAPSGVSKGDMYTVTVAGTFFTVAVEVGDVLIAEIDTATVEADWTIVNKNIDPAAFATAAHTHEGAAVLSTGEAGGSKFLREDGDGTSSWQAIPKQIECIAIACSDETTALTTGTAKATFRMPYAFTLTAVRISVTTAPTGAALTVDINEGGTTILSTKLTIDATEKTSTTAATAAVISDTALADDAEITIDIDTVGSTIAGAGLKVYLIGKQT
jgi:hypothetical protein